MLLTVLFMKVGLVVTYLTQPQWMNIKRLIVRPDLSPDIRSTLNNVIYTHYTKWAFYETVRFKKHHYYKCKHISTEELNMYALVGLQKGIEKYDGLHSFLNWIHYYIKGHLSIGMTELHPLTTIPARKRMMRKTSALEKNQKTQFAGFDDEWIFDKNTKRENEESVSLSHDTLKSGIWGQVDKMQPSNKKIFQYKYDYDFTVLRTNKEIGELMACSEENIRQILHKVKMEILQDKIKTNDKKEKEKSK